MVNGQALEVVLVGHFVVVFTCSSGGGDDDVVDAGYYVVRRFISGLLEIVDLVVLVLIGIMRYIRHIFFYHKVYRLCPF